MINTHTYSPRPWQIKAQETINKTFKSFTNDNETQIVSNVAAVGSGKTDVAAFAMGKFISENKDSNTIQFFICPTIRLCGVQAEAIKNFLRENNNFVFNGEKNVNNSIVVDMKEINCEKNFNTKDLHPNNYKHLIVIYCDKSFWNEDPNVINCWNATRKAFFRFAEAGFKFGVFAFDEAHNYTNNLDKILNLEKYNLTYTTI